MKRVWHNYKKWEEYHAGMWRVIPSGMERARLIHLAEKFTGDAGLYGSWMLKVTKSWPISCEHNLTDLGQNRRAWIGHAAACLAHGIPEDITRSAWGLLSKQQQDDANEKAEQAIAAWESAYAK